MASTSVDGISSQPFRLRLPYLGIVRAPGPMPMNYRPSELADLAKKGLAHWCYGRGRLWINGQGLAGWIAQTQLKQLQQQLE